MMSYRPPLFYRPFFVSLLVVVAVAGTFWWNLRTYRNNLAQRQGQGMALLCLDQLLLDMTDAEVGQRGYVYDHHSSCLSLYQRAVAEANRDLEEMDGCLGPGEVEAITLLARERMAELKVMVDAAGRGEMEQAHWLMTRDRERGAMTRLRRATENVRQAHLENLNLLQERTLREGHQLMWITLTGLSVVSMLCLGGFVLSWSAHQKALAREKSILEDKYWLAQHAQSSPPC